MSEISPSASGRARGWLYVLFILVFGLIVYRDAFWPGNVLFTTDDGLGAIAMRKSLFPHAFWSGWYDITAAGIPMFTPINATNLLLLILSPVAFMNLIHLVDLVVGSWFLMLFLRLRGVGWMASVLGALVTYWLGSTFFLTYAGHIGKFGAVMFAGIYLYLVERAVRDRSWSFAVLAGAAMAGMFLEQQDSALFFAMVLGPYAVFRGWQAFRFNVVAHAKVLAPLLVIAAIVALHSVYSAMSFYRMDIPADGNEQSRQELWDYCTQWSWPPSETIEFIAPGYMGWRSGDPSGPYWGALGRAPQWTPQYGPNGMNFKLETFYIGFLPALFMALALYASLIRKRDQAEARQQIIFWTVAGVVTFVLACGKYTPLYRLFFELPGVSSIRNPVKFMQITQFSLGILAAVGLDYWLKQAGRAPVKGDDDRPVIAAFRKGTLYAACALTALLVILAAQQGSSVISFREQGWGEMAQAIVSTRLIAAAHLAFMGWLGFGLFTLAMSGGKAKFSSAAQLGWIVLAVVAADQLLASRRYVSAVKVDSLVSRGDLIPAVEQGLGDRRLYLWDPPPNTGNEWQGLYNQWHTILMPNYQIPTINMISMRLPDDYKAFYQAMGNKPVQMWSHMALGLAVTPAKFWMAVRGNPALRDSFEEVAGFNVVPAGGSGVTTMRAGGQQPAQHVLLKYKRPSDRAALVTAWQGGELAQALEYMAGSEPLQTVFVSPSVPTDWPASGAPGRTGSVEMKNYRAGRMEFSVQSSQPAVLRVAEKFAPDWKASIDGREVAVMRADGIFLGVFMEPSDAPRTVVVEFAPQRQTLYLQLAGFGVSGLAFIAAFFVRRRD